MKMTFTILILCCLILFGAESHMEFLENLEQPSLTGYDKSSPLFLTNYLEKGIISQARDLSSVKPLIGDVESYSGLFTVNKSCNSNIFFWFFPSKTLYKTAPVLVWLQGGPGTSSLYGVFIEHGPYILDENFNITLRNYSWTKTMSVIYIDNPVGTGYSFTDSEKCYARNENDVGIYLYETMKQFYQMFPELSENKLFIAGESYGGKYAPALAYAIYNANKAGKSKMNLVGIVIGDGTSDPIHMLNYGDYLFEIGLVDQNGREVLKKKEHEIVSLLENKEYIKAFKKFDPIFSDTGEGKNDSLFTNLTGYTNYYNYLTPNLDSSDESVDKFVQQNHIREAIHVGNLSFHIDRTEVLKYLMEDQMKSVVPKIQVLIEKHRMMFYNGQLDIIAAYPLTEEMLINLKWSGTEEYKKAPRKIWKVENEIAGYSKTVGNLIEILVRSAGHMVPANQPRFAFDMINSFVFNKPFTSND